MEKQDNIKAVLFDFDGTLVFLPTDYDRMRSRLKELFLQFGINSDFQSIMDSIDHSISLLKGNTPEGLLQEIREKAYNIIESEELEAVGEAEIAENTTDILRWLKDRGKKIAIITRNGGRCVKEAFDKFNLHSPDLVVSRDDVNKIKPDKEHVDFLLPKLNLRPEECIIVGDSIHDLELGRNANIPVVLVGYKHNAKGNLKDKQEVISSLLELKAIVKD